MSLFERSKAWFVLSVVSFFILVVAIATIPYADNTIVRVISVGSWLACCTFSLVHGIELKRAGK